MIAALMLLTGSPLAARAAVSIEPPPGWRDVTAQSRAKDVILALKGPESSAFVVSRAPGVELDNAAAVRRYLGSVLEGARAGARRDYRAAARLETRDFSNGLTARLLRAELDGKPRLMLALIETADGALLATLSSAAPEAMLGPLLGALKLDAAGPRGEGVARSLDGQLELALGGGLRMRAPTAEEKRQGVVLAVQDGGSEAIFLKLSEEDSAPREQAAIVRATVAGALGIKPDSVFPARSAPTPAGPAAVYAWARAPGALSDSKFAAGFLPWTYWGYSVLARGPQADELLVGVLAALKQGPTAVPGLVAATPRLEAPGEGGRGALIAGLAAAAALGAGVWSVARKKTNLPG